MSKYVYDTLFQKYEIVLMGRQWWDNEAHVRDGSTIQTNKKQNPSHREDFILVHE